jgi:hypothetical protein
MRPPQSKFVRSKIRALPFTAATRAYINRLLSIERLARDGVTTWAAGLLDQWLCAKYPEEHEAIWREVNPGGYDRALRDRARRRRALLAEERREARARRRQLAGDRELWRQVKQAAPHR